MKTEYIEIVDRLRDVEQGFTMIDESSDLPKIAADELERLRGVLDLVRAIAEVTQNAPGSGDYYIGRESFADDIIDLLEEHERGNADHA